MPSAHIAGWLLAGPEPGKADKWRVFFQIEQRWCVAVIGRDRNGSYNVITMHSPSDRNYLPNMMAKESTRLGRKRGKVERDPWPDLTRASPEEAWKR
jgi:hypothetical protein